MSLVIKVVNITVSDSGKQFKGRMYNISATMILKKKTLFKTTTLLEKSFSEKHKDVHQIKDTMEKIRTKMDTVKKKVEAELALKAKAEKEIPIMTAKFAKEKK